MIFFPKTTIVFSTECIPYFDWQALALYHSIKSTNPHMKIVRLMACDDYKPENDAIGKIIETFVHENMRNSNTVSEKGYPSYNKPFSLFKYFEKRDNDSEYFIMLDADMIVREPLDPRKLGVKSGVVFSSEYKYLLGAENNFKDRFLVTKNQVDKVGGMYIFHRSDVKDISLLWFEYTKKVREFMNNNLEHFLKETLAPEDFHDEKKRVQAQWHAEMYGYIFAASHLNIKHIKKKGFLLYAGFPPIQQIKPSIIHYGISFRIEEVIFDKLKLDKFDVYKCSPNVFPNKYYDENTTKTDLISIETLGYINSGICNFYDSHCKQKCDSSIFKKTVKDSTYIKNFWKCSNQHEECERWKEAGECSSNQLFMNDICTKSCGMCPIDDTNYFAITIFSIIFLFTLFILSHFKNVKNKVDKSHIV